jgi:hypothetical protein
VSAPGRGQAIDLVAGRAEVLFEELTEVGRELLDAGMRRGVGLRLIAVDAAGHLVGVDHRDKADEQR